MTPPPDIFNECGGDQSKLKKRGYEQVITVVGVR